MKKNEGGFIEETFGSGSEGRDPFPDKSGTPVSESFADIVPDITDDELMQFINRDESLSPQRLGQIAASLKNDKELYVRFIELVRQAGK